jgi:hypothetical protein
VWVGCMRVALVVVLAACCCFPQQLVTDGGSQARRFLAGILIGATPLHHYVLPPLDPANDAVAHLSLELASIAHLARSCMAAAALIGAAALPVQASRLPLV